MLPIEWEIRDKGISASDVDETPEPIRYETEWFQNSEGDVNCTAGWSDNVKKIIVRAYESDADLPEHSFKRAVISKFEHRFPVGIDALKNIEIDILGHIKEILRQYHLSKDLNNVTIQGPDGSVEYKAHVEVLAAHSTYCETLFSQFWWSERADEEAAMVLDQSAYYDGMSSFLDYLYTGDIDALIRSEHALSVLMLALELAAEAVVSDVLDRIYLLLNSENVMSLLAIADLHSVKKLKEICITFLLKNMCSTELSCEHGPVIITAEAKASLNTLRVAFEQSTQVNGDVYNDAKELVYMLRDAHHEAEMAYRESKARNDKELQECRARMEHLIRYRPLALELAYKRDFEQRLMNVDATLDQQRQKLDLSAKFIDGQLAAMHRLLCELMIDIS